MRYHIFYFSGTGNTKLVGMELKSRLEKSGYQAEITSIEALHELDVIPLDDVIFGFGFPVHKFSYPRLFDKPIEKIELIKNESAISEPIPYFLFNTYARFSANSLHNLASRFEEMDFDLITERSFKSPSNGIASMKSSDSFEYRSVMFFEERLNELLDSFVHEIIDRSISYKQSRFRKELSGSRIEKLRLRIVSDIERVKYPQMQIDESRCINCGLCAAKCPEANLTNLDDMIRIEDEFDCLHCLRCMHICPHHAISFGELTIGPQRYTPAIRNELFRQALDGQLSPTEFNDKTLKSWRRASIRYWLKHRVAPWSV
ncbi:MAG: EFR1 family ferrodoxin [Candidatus Thorarchaeota archaeon]